MDARRRVGRSGAAGYRVWVDRPRDGSMLSLLTAPAGAALGALSGGVGLVRRNRPLHPKGVVLAAVLHRSGGQTRRGAAWLDEDGEDRGLVRLSRSVGLPDQLPDILGLAFSFRSGDDRRHDLLLASTGVGPVSRFVLTPRRDPLNSAYTCLFPYAGPRGLVVIGAVPAQTRPAVSLNDLAADDGFSPVSFRMLAAAPRQDWEQFGELTIGAVDRTDEAMSLRFDPMVHPLPGLSWQPWLVRLREPAYAAARHITPRS